MIVIVCGSRVYQHNKLVNVFLEGLNAYYRLEVYNGGAAGADKMAKDWAVRTGRPNKTFKADWNRHGKAAGPKRNQEMLDHALAQGQDVQVLAFKDDFDRTLDAGGTEHMCLIARVAGVPVTTIDRIVDDHTNHPRLTAHLKSGDN